MKFRAIISHAMAAAVAVSSCTGASPAQENHSYIYENCFNGRLLVEEDGLWGMAAAEDSSLVLEPGYEELVFISDDLALGCKDAEWTLLDRDGMVVASSMDRSFLLSQAVDLHESAKEANEEAWNVILDLYDRLSSICLDGQVSTSERLDLMGQIEERVAAAPGIMNEEQRSRFQRIRDRHKQLDR